jgi:hypothetical protein
MLPCCAALSDADFADQLAANTVDNAIEISLVLCRNSDAEILESLDARLPAELRRKCVPLLAGRERFR